MVVTRGGCSLISLDTLNTVVLKSVESGTFKDLLQASSKSGNEAEVYAELFSIACDSNDPRKAVSAMLENANSPRFVDGQIQFSYVADGLWRFVSRCLRPVWFKPVVAVEPNKRSTNKASTRKMEDGGAVKILVSGRLLDRVRKPLYSLQNLLRTFFLPIISNAPMGTVSREATKVQPSEDSMGVDSLLTTTMKFYNASANGVREQDGSYRVSICREFVCVFLANAADFSRRHSSAAVQHLLALLLILLYFTLRRSQPPLLDCITSSQPRRQCEKARGAVPALSLPVGVSFRPVPQPGRSALLCARP